MSVLKYFKNIPRSPSIGRQAQCVIFFFKFATKSLEKKKEGAVAPPTGDRPLSPEGWATGPPFFFSRDFVANLKEKNYILGLSPYGRATGVYF